MKVILAVIMLWAGPQGGTIVFHHPYPRRPRQMIAVVDFPIVFHPSGLVGQEYQMVLAWRTPGWNHGASIKMLGNVLHAPPGYAFSGPVTTNGTP